MCDRQRLSDFCRFWAGEYSHRVQVCDQPHLAVVMRNLQDYLNKNMEGA